LAIELAHEQVNDHGAVVPAIKRVLRRWRESIEPSLQRAFVEYAFGKVPDKIETTGLESKTTLVLHWPHERSDLVPLNGNANGRS
jgi:NADPH-dependent ferric siderophore reductase